MSARFKFKSKTQFSYNLKIKSPPSIYPRETLARILLGANEGNAATRRFTQYLQLHYCHTLPHYHLIARRSRFKQIHKTLVLTHIATARAADRPKRLRVYY